MAKSAHAFRTIGEVSEALDTPAHVLRFWESKFAQVRPVKRAGGRRYYRPEDLALLCGIKALLHEQGMTIKGVQKLLREKGARHVADHGLPASEPLPPRPRIASGADAVEDAVLVLDREEDSTPNTAPNPAPRTQPASPLSAVLAADPARLMARAARIAPLLHRIESLRLRMIAARDRPL